MKSSWSKLLSKRGQQYWSFPFRKDSLIYHLCGLKLNESAISTPFRGQCYKTLYGHKLQIFTRS